jgi:HD-like signal output (HDOD) protein
MTGDQSNTFSDFLAQQPELQSQLSILKRLQQLAASNDISINKLSKIIAEDPSLGAKLIKFANASNSQQPVYTISQAVMQLGASTLCQTYKNLILDSLPENHKQTALLAMDN